MRTLARWTVFPAMVAAVVGGSLVLLERGVPGEVLVPPVFVLTILAVALLERALPYVPLWNRAHGDVAADAVYLPMTVSINAIIEPGARVLAAAWGNWLAASWGIGLWPSHSPLLLQLLLACVVAELFDYFAHRVMHENAWLWRFHAVHHSSARLYWLNATRAHPGEMLFRGAVGVLPLALLGAPREVFILLAVVNVVVGFCQHANVDFELGPLSWVFSVGEMHRWHHSRRRGEADSNYGNNFLIWDAVFGTRYRPRGRQTPDSIGIDGLESFPRDLRGQLAAPFRWRHLVSAGDPSRGATAIGRDGVSGST